MKKVPSIEQVILRLLILFPLFLSAAADSQDSVVSGRGFMKDLPAEVMRGQYRILVAECSLNHMEEIKSLAEEFTLKTKQNSYYIKNGNRVELHTGDYYSKEFAKARLSWLKENVKKCSLVRSNNDSIVMIAVYSGKKCKFRTRDDEIAEQETADELTIARKNDVVDFSVWEKPKYLEANTAVNEDYLTSEEKQVYYYLNLMRMNPGLFAVTYLKYLKGSKDYYESTLLRDLNRLSPKPILKPDRKLFESAKCHAVESGKSGYIGHNRSKCKEYFIGECCDYGDNKALETVVRLLVDKGVESLGHRKICMMDFERLGVSIKPHKIYKANTVLDFGYDPDESLLPSKSINEQK